MSVEPIRPEDHSIIGNSVENAVRVNQSWTSWHAALEEAIHQTFERDTEYAPKLEQWEYSYAAWEEADDGGESPMLPSRPADPDTEIDRLARLIVQGEYRRRSQANER